MKLLSALSAVLIASIAIAAGGKFGGGGVRTVTVAGESSMDGGVTLYRFAPPGGAGVTDPAALVGFYADGGTDPFTFTRASTATCERENGTIDLLESGVPCLKHGGVEIQPTATNRALYSNDLSNAAWTKTGMSCVSMTGGPLPGQTFSRCTATAANATVTQAITASGYGALSFYVNRVTGTGVVEATRNGGTNWIPVTTKFAATGTWRRIGSYDLVSESPNVWSSYVASTLSPSVTNPVIGLRLVTSGDVIDVTGVQDETGNMPTPVIETGAATATRAATSLRRTSNVAIPGFNRLEGCVRWCLRPGFHHRAVNDTNLFGLGASGAVKFNIQQSIYEQSDAINVYISGAEGAKAGHKMVRNENACFRTSYSAAGGFMRFHALASGEIGALRNNNLLVPFTGYATNTNYPRPDFYIGTSTDVNQSVFGVLSDIRFGDSPDGCL